MIAELLKEAYQRKEYLEEQLSNDKDNQYIKGQIKENLLLIVRLQQIELDIITKNVSHEDIKDISCGIELMYYNKKKVNMCEHEYEDDVTCGVSILVCNKCGDVK